MFRISNGLIGLLNILTTLISIPIMASALYSHFHGDTECHRSINMPVFYFGVFLFIISLIGLFGSCCRITFFMWIYLFVMFVLIVVLVAFTIFAFIITNKGAGEVVSGKGYKEYHLGDYSNWLQKRVGNPKTWAKIKSCLTEAKVCNALGVGIVSQQASAFYKQHLSPITSGCCKPPSSCGFIFLNSTYWKLPKSGAASIDPDCVTWSNGQSNLCFDCDSCKAGILANLNKNWRKVAIVNVSVLIFLVTVYSIGCCAFKNNRADNRYKGHRV
ncbi:hypothetical protein ACLOJK_035279 [Asimina triloba]